MILYSVVARAKDATLLVEFIVAGVDGNFPQITVKVLEHIVSSFNWPSALGTLESSSKVELLSDGERRTFVQRHDESTFAGPFSAGIMQWSCFGYNPNDMEASRRATSGDMDFYFHLIRKDNLICLCISDDSDARYHAVIFDFLDSVHVKFTKSYAPYKVTKAKAYEMDKKFTKELGKLTYFYNEHRNNMVRKDKLDDLVNEVEDLKGILGRNITMVLGREEKLDNFVEKSQLMMEGTKVFTKRSARLKARVKRKYYSHFIIAFVFGVLVLYVFLGEICGYTLQKCSSRQEGHA